MESTEKQDIQDFVLVQILYQCSMIRCPRSGEGIPRPLLRYLDSIERVKSVAWARFFYDEIIRGIGVALEGKKERKKAYVPGCMTLLCVSFIILPILFHSSSVLFLACCKLGYVISILFYVSSTIQHVIYVVQHVILQQVSSIDYFVSSIDCFVSSINCFVSSIDCFVSSNES